MKKHRQFRDYEVQKKKNNTGIYLAIFLAVLMIGGVGGIFLQNQNTNSDQVFGKYTFKYVNNQWITKINKKDVTFFYSPQQVLKFNISDDVIGELKNSQALIIAFDPFINTSTQLQVIDLFKFQLAELFQDMYGKQVFSAVTAPTTKYKFPVVTCANATAAVPLLTLAYGDATETSVTDHCISITATDEYSLLGMLDNLRYTLYGVFDGQTN